MALNDIEKIEAIKLYKAGLSYREIALELDKTYDEVRGYIRRSPEYAPQPQGSSQPAFRFKQSTSTPDILELIKRPVERDVLLERLDISERVLDALLDDLEDEGYLFDRFGDKIGFSKVPHSEKQTLDVDWKGNRTIKFGLISDTHIGSKWAQISLIHEAYETFKREGIKHVYHAGDITEGWKMRPGHEHECYIHGSDDYVEETIQVYPKVEGITTYFITGNHDLSFVKLAGIDIGVQIANTRKDMVYLGQEIATVNLTPECTLELMHPRGGSGYAVSYRPQKIVESLEGGTKPNLMCIGHYHKRLDMEYRNVEIVLPGAMQSQTPFMRGKALISTLGYYIIEIEVTESGQIDRFRPEFFKTYVPIENDYLNWR